MNENPKREQDKPESTPQKPPEHRPYSRKARVLAWVGVAFMVFLVIMYTYSLASGKIMEI